MVSVLLLHAFLLPTCQTFPVFDQRVALECVSKFCRVFTHVLMSNDQYSSASSLPKDHLSRTTDKLYSYQCFPPPKQVPTPEGIMNPTATSVFPLPNQTIAVSVSVGEEVMNSTATRLFPRQAILLRWLMHPLVPISPQSFFIQGNGQDNFLRILCAAPTSQHLRGTLFSTGRPHHLEAMVLKTSWVLHLHHSNKLFSP